jgi:hypothetical protein
MPLNMDWHGYREVSSSGGLALPSLCLKTGETQRSDGLAFFLDEPQAATTRQDLDQAWFMQVSRHRSWDRHETSCVWRIGLILLPVAGEEDGSLSGRVSLFRRIGVWLFREPQITNMEDPEIEWLEEQKQNRNNALEPIFARWLKQRTWMEATIV